MKTKKEIEERMKVLLEESKNVTGTVHAVQSVEQQLELLEWVLGENE